MSTTNPSTQNGGLAETRAGQLAAYLREPLQAFAFWAAIAIPLAYVPLLTSGFETGLTPALTFAGLILANVVALVLGHGHGRD